MDTSIFGVEAYSTLESHPSIPPSEYKLIVWSKRKRLSALLCHVLCNTTIVPNRMRLNSS